MRLSALLFAAAVGTTTASLAVQAVAAPPVLARQKKGRAHKSKGPPEVKKSVRLSPKGLRFGLSLDELSALYVKVFEKEFVPLYRRVEPGPRMKELDAELAEKKKHIKRNHVEFGSLPSGLDNTPLGQEFTYNNGESMTHVTLRSGVKRYFFFYNGRLWKVYDVYKGPKMRKLGGDFDAIVENLAKKFGTKPRRQEPDPKVGRMLEHADWATGDMVVRVINRGGDEIALVYMARKAQEKLEKHRANDRNKSEKLDSDVSAVTKGKD